MWVSSPTYKIQNRPQEIQYLDVSASHNRQTGELLVNVLNRSKDNDIATRVESQAAAMTGDVAVWELNHPDLKATHTFGDDRKVRPSTRNIKVAVEGDGFTYTFPAHSLTILKVKVRGSS